MTQVFAVFFGIRVFHFPLWNLRCDFKPMQEFTMYFSLNSLHPTKSFKSCTPLPPKTNWQRSHQVCLGFGFQSTEEADFQRLCAEADELLDSASSGNIAKAEKRLVGADQAACTVGVNGWVLGFGCAWQWVVTWEFGNTNYIMIMGILAAPPKATPPRNKGLIRPY